MKLKRLILLLILPLIMAGACYFIDESDTVDLDDIVFFDPDAQPPGEITELTAEISGLSQTNPYINIKFNVPVNPGTVRYAENGDPVSVFVYFPDEQYPDPPVEGNLLEEGVGYSAIEGNSLITLDLSAANPATGQSVRVILTDDIRAYTDNDLSLTPADEVIVVE